MKFSQDITFEEFGMNRFQSILSMIVGILTVSVIDKRILWTVLILEIVIPYLDCDLSLNFLYIIKLFNNMWVEHWFTALIDQNIFKSAMRGLTSRTKGVSSEILLYILDDFSILMPPRRQMITRAILCVRWSVHHRAITGTGNAGTRGKEGDREGDKIYLAKS